MPEKNIIERAFELAAIGTCKNVQEIRQQLRKEGYLNVTEHLTGLSIRRQLIGVIREKTNKPVEEKARPG